MPKVATEREMVEMEVAVDPSLTQHEDVPLFEGVKVVYLGAEDHKSVPLRGQVVRHTTGDGDDAVTSKRVSPLFGMAYYDFSELDVHDRKVEGDKFRMPMTHHIQKVRDKRFCVVENAAHLHWFAQRNKEFHIVAPPAVGLALSAYIQRKESQRKGGKRLIEEVTAA